MHVTDEAEPNAVERLTAEIVEMQLDILELRARLDGRIGLETPERAERWKRTLAIVQAVLGEKRQ
jgi:hypothetical protein